MNDDDLNLKMHTDCAYFRGSMPCVFHKRDSRPCEDCPDYTPFRVKILLVKLDAMGDVLRTTSILPALHRAYPGAQVTWVTRERSRELLEGNPLLHRVLSVEQNYLETMLTESFAAGLGLDADALAAKILSLAKCEQKFGYVVGQFGTAEPVNPEARAWWLMGLNDKLKSSNRRTYQEIIHEISRLPGPPARPQLPGRLLDANFIARKSAAWGLASGRKVIGINTGGGGRWQCKKWTVPGYVSLLRRLGKSAPRATLLLYGGPEESDFNAEILAAKIPGLVDTGCRNSLKDFVSLVSLADVFFTPDSLGFHISVALEKSTVVLVGPTSPWELDVYGRGQVLTADAACASCYRSHCERTPTCMEALDPAVVETAILRQLPIG
jgi:heptosyltransferase-2